MEESLIKFFKSIYSGYLYIKSSPSIKFTFLILITIQTMFSIIIVSVPMIAHTILKIPANMSGVYIVIPAGLGSMIGAFYIPSFLKNMWRKRSLIEISLLMLSMLIFVENISCLLSSLFYQYHCLVYRNFLFGNIFYRCFYSFTDFLQEHTHNNYKGRIFGNMWFVITIITIIPLIFFGVITEIFGIKLVLFSVSVVCFLMYYFSKYGSFNLINKSDYEI